MPSADEAVVADVGTLVGELSSKHFSLTGLSLRAEGHGFSPATKRVAPGYFYWKIEEK